MKSLNRVPLKKLQDFPGIVARQGIPSATRSTERLPGVGRSVETKDTKTGVFASKCKDTQKVLDADNKLASVYLDR